MEINWKYKSSVWQRHQILNCRNRKSWRKNMHSQKRQTEPRNHSTFLVSAVQNIAVHKLPVGTGFHGHVEHPQTHSVHPGRQGDHPQPAPPASAQHCFPQRSVAQPLHRLGFFDFTRFFGLHFQTPRPSHREQQHQNQTHIYAEDPHPNGRLKCRVQDHTNHSSQTLHCRQKFGRLRSNNKLKHLHGINRSVLHQQQQKDARTQKPP